MKAGLLILMCIAISADAQTLTQPETPAAPLYVVKTENSEKEFEVSLASGYSITSIDPTWIESISVLKDAAATDKYGVRGAQGVIIITISNEHAGELPANVQIILAGGDSRGIVYVLQNHEGTREFTINDFKGFNLNQLDTHWIESINVVKGEDAIRLYGPAAKGAVVIQIRDNYLEKLPEQIRVRLTE